MNSSTETMCTFKTAAMFCICRTTEESDFRIPTNLRRLESIMVFGAHHWKGKLFMKQKQKRKVKIKIQNNCEEQRKGMEVNYIRWLQSWVAQ